ncbi:deoxynucleoside kinase [Candidatus Babeliales bacterium]|nr:deoxynucleoside kinase [Candidatus Babeliales bacterium]
MQSKSLFLMIEGNIGSGKSTFLNIVKNKIPNVNIILEPVQNWQTLENNENLLDLFYKDMPRWSYTFQTFAFISRIKTLIEHEKNFPTLLHCVERSVFCDRYCFAKNCFGQKFMTSLEWTLYKDLFSWLVKNYAPKPAGFVYLRTTPEVSQKRIKHRKRHEESSIAFSYLQALHEQHEQWLIHKKNIDPQISNVPILSLDCNENFEENKQVQNKHLEELQHFMYNLQKASPTKPQVGNISL